MKSLDICAKDLRITPHLHQRLHGRKDFQSVISVRSVLRTDFKACILPPLQLGNE